MNSTYKYYGTAFVIFEFHSFDLQASVANDPTVTFRLFRLCTLFLKIGSHYPKLMRDNSTYASNFTSLVFSGSHYYREPPAPAGRGATLKVPEFAEAEIIDKSILANSGKWSEG
jgi:hypothetical protein